MRLFLPSRHSGSFVVRRDDKTVSVPIKVEKRAVLLRRGVEDCGGGWCSTGGAPGRQVPLPRILRVFLSQCFKVGSARPF